MAVFNWGGFITDKSLFHNQHDYFKVLLREQSKLKIYQKTVEHNFSVVKASTK